MNESESYFCFYVCSSISLMIKVHLFDATVLDGEAIVQMLNCRTAKTFQDTVFAPYMAYLDSTPEKKNLPSWPCLECILPNSLKVTARDNHLIRVQILGKEYHSASAVMPKNWKEFLHVVRNKIELFVFLSEYAACRSQRLLVCQRTVCNPWKWCTPFSYWAACKQLGPIPTRKLTSA